MLQSYYPIYIYIIILIYLFIHLFIHSFIHLFINYIRSSGGSPGKYPILGPPSPCRRHGATDNFRGDSCDGSIDAKHRSPAQLCAAYGGAFSATGRRWKQVGEIFKSWKKWCWTFWSTMNLTQSLGGISKYIALSCVLLGDGFKNHELSAWNKEKSPKKMHQQTSTTEMKLSGASDLEISRRKQERRIRNRKWIKVADFTTRNTIVKWISRDSL